MTLFTRNLGKCGKDITIEDRDVRIINGLPEEVFSNPRGDRGIITTVRGVKVFDTTNTERVATHKICIPYRNDVGAEQWVQIVGKTKRIKILTAENCCEDDRVLILMCTERGEDSKIVNQA